MTRSESALLVMAGLVPAIHEGVVSGSRLGKIRHMDAWAYIVTTRPNGTLCVGVTSNLARRVWEHREGLADGFTKRYGLKRLVFAERHADIRTAIQRERNMKHWSRTWKVRLILAANANWEDLYDRLG
ncbi:MAG TPA: GIY-YIG nuclease family protein [Stellaceae bacterium]|jgi:putative endonuclease|nr:GIY-YIG nuclease family protein [Stellaceae bacterium]